MKRTLKVFAILTCLSLLVSMASFGASSAYYYDVAEMPLNKINVTQGAYGSYSHSNQNAMDFTGSPGFAPFTGTITRIEPSYNAVWFVSNNKVYYADGSYDYMTVLYMHDDYLNSNVYVGAVLAKSTYFYDPGVKGGATGSHIHLAVFRGRHASATPGTSWSGGGNVYANKAFFALMGTPVTASGGYFWQKMGDVDFDGTVTNADAQKILRFSANIEIPSTVQSIAADVDFSGDVTTSDARAVLRFAEGL